MNIKHAIDKLRAKHQQASARYADSTDDYDQGQADAFGYAVATLEADAQAPTVTTAGHDLADRIEGFVDVLDERKRQDAQWGGPSHDDTHLAMEWLDFVEQTDAEARGRLVKIAALALAAIQSIDRKARAEAAR